MLFSTCANTSVNHRLSIQHKKVHIPIQSN